MTVEQLIKDEAKLAKKQGVKEGKTLGMELLTELYDKLARDNRFEDIKASFNDEELRMQLFKEYGIDFDE